MRHTGWFPSYQQTQATTTATNNRLVSAGLVMVSCWRIQACATVILPWHHDTFIIFVVLITQKCLLFSFFWKDFSDIWKINLLSTQLDETSPHTRYCFMLPFSFLRKIVNWKKKKKKTLNCPYDPVVGKTCEYVLTETVCIIRVYFKKKKKRSMMWMDTESPFLIAMPHCLWQFHYLSCTATTLPVVPLWPCPTCPTPRMWT